jgi:hypothetical protein
MDDLFTTADMTTCKVDTYTNVCGDVCNCGWPVFSVETASGETMVGKMDGASAAMLRKMPDHGAPTATVDFDSKEMAFFRAEAVKGPWLDRV